MSQPEPPGPDEVQVSTDLQMRAVSNVVRHRILGLLADGPASISQLAERMGILKGSASYHVRFLERAGLVKVVSTRKVRGVRERHYARVARKIVLPDPGPGEPDVLMRHALADLEAAPASDERTVLLRHVRIGADTFAEFAERLEALSAELATRSRPDQPAADLAIAFFRPGKPDPEPGEDA